jgi:hypothetical protein
MWPQRVDTILLEVSNTRDLGSRHTGQEMSQEEEGGAETAVADGGEMARLEGSGESVRSTVTSWSLGGVTTEAAKILAAVGSLLVLERRGRTVGVSRLAAAEGGGGGISSASWPSVSVRSITEMLAPEEAWEEGARAAGAGLLLSTSLSMISTD